MRELGREEDYKNYEQYVLTRDGLVKKYDCEFEFEGID